MSQLVGLANNAKWSELQALMASRGPEAPYWRTLAINGYVYPESGWDADWSYHFRLGEYKQIEWCEMEPREATGAISLEALAAACKGIGLEFEVKSSEGVVRVIGYRRL